MMIFGSTNGITYFNPEDIENPIGNKNKVVFGDIFIGKNKVSYNNKELILEHYDKDLSIEYFLPIYENLNKYSNLTTGKVYWNILNKERKGEYHERDIS